MSEVKDRSRDIGPFVPEPDDDRLICRCEEITKGEIRQNYYFFAELKESVDENLSSNEGQCQWFSLDEISSLEMPFSAKYVVEHFCKFGKFTNTLYVGVTSAEEVTFFNLTES